MKNFKDIFDAIGPLRYQTGVGDCVPTTVINAILVITKKNLSQRLQQLIWSISLDNIYSELITDKDGHPKTDVNDDFIFRKKLFGTRRTSCKILSDTLNAWTTYAKREYQEEYHPINFHSEILEEGGANIERINKCLDADGVACMSINSGKHYILILEKIKNDNNQLEYFCFDPSWNIENNQATNNNSTHGISNKTYTVRQLSAFLAHGNNKWVHIIEPLVDS